MSTNSLRRFRPAADTIPVTSGAYTVRLRRPLPDHLRLLSSRAL